jgi:hypothetical protein
MNSDTRRAEKSSRWAEADLVAGKDWAKNGTTPKAKREGRRMVRAAKRRKAKANRRAVRAQLREFE